MSGGGERTFLVESYVPELDERTAAAITSRLRAAVRKLEEEALRWLRSFALLDDEMYLCIVAARDLDHVVQLNERARLEHDHVAEVVAIEGPASPSHSEGDSGTLLDES